jgi:uncharacterized protein
LGILLCFESGVFVAVDLVQIRKLAEQREDENFSFCRFLKTECNLEPNKVDQRVFEITRHVWAGIDCTTCANCCRELTPTFSEEEVDRVAHRLRMQRREFIQTYLKPRTPTVIIPGRPDPLLAHS